MGTVRLASPALTWNWMRVPSSTLDKEIYVGDESTPQYSELVHTSDGTVNTTISGTGKKMVKVYFDGVLDQGQSYERSFE